MHDLVIRGGTVADGTGGPARTADVAVTDGVVTEVGRVDGPARRELDAGRSARDPRLRRHPHALRRAVDTYMLSHWVRGRTRGRRLDLEYAVHRLTGDPARFYGLGDRGVLAPGRRADLNVIDFDGLGLVRPEQRHDLPGGAGRLIQRSHGYVATFVAGNQTIDHDERTDALPGRLVRGAR